MYEYDETLAIQPVTDNSKLDEYYRELGREYYEGAFEDPLPEVLPLFDKITALKNKMNNKLKCCPQCGTILEDEALFCGECGYPVK